MLYSCLYKEGSAELVEWVEVQKELLYDGRAAEIVAELGKRLAQLDPGKQSTQERLQKIREYIHFKSHGTR